MRTVQSYHARGKFYFVISLVVVCIMMVTIYFQVQGKAVSSEDDVLNTTIGMTCFPPPNPGGEPGTGSAPPCLLPVGIEDDLVAPNPVGSAHMIVKSDDTAKFIIDLQGLRSDLVVTAWISYFFPPGPAPDPIFAPIGEGLPSVAAVSAPLAPTYAGFTDGLGVEPNQFTIDSNGKGKLIVDLDYNPLKGAQGPLRNSMSNVDQSLAPIDSGAFQSLCCPDGIPAPKYQPVGSAYLRHFDANGFPVLDGNGRPDLIESPVPVAFLAIVVHTDRTTHGINPGIPIFPMPGTPASTGDHYLLGIFDLRDFHMD